MPINNTHGRELMNDDAARYLNTALSEYEFEKLIRLRLQDMKMQSLRTAGGTAENYFAASLNLSYHDGCKWTIVVGSTYNDTVQCRGEVLYKTMMNACTNYVTTRENKLSTLLPATTPQSASLYEDKLVVWEGKMASPPMRPQAVIDDNIDRSN